MSRVTEGPSHVEQTTPWVNLSALIGRSGKDLLALESGSYSKVDVP